MMDNIENAYPNSLAATVIGQIRPELESERSVLRKLLAGLGTEPSRSRRVLGWVSEKFVELKLHADDPDHGTLRLLESVEMLSLGISGKIALWKVLDSVKDAEPLLTGVNFKELLESAHAQHSRMESVRINAARDAFQASHTASNAGAS